MLLKNGKKGDKPLLPLPKKTGKILVAGTHADNLGYQCGGWTITWQGLDGNDLTIGMFTDDTELHVTYVSYTEFGFDDSQVQRSLRL